LAWRARTPGIYIPLPTVVAPNTGNIIYFGMQVPAGTPSGNYVQTITFNNVCASPLTNTIIANVIVPSICYTFVSPTAITFGNVIVGSNYATNVPVTDNDVGGNFAATMYVDGNSNFVYLSNNIYVTNTLYSNSNQGTLYTGTALSNALSTANIYMPAPTQTSTTTTNYIYFGQGVPGGQAPGLYTSAFTISNQC
jgi:hypothetical protein